MFVHICQMRVLGILSLFYLIHLNRISLNTEVTIFTQTGWPAGLSNPPVSTSLGLGFQRCMTMPSICLGAVDSNSVLPTEPTPSDHDTFLFGINYKLSPIPFSLKQNKLISN